jgi:3-hydroxyisobutyrate dehydrogenase
MRRVGFIGIGHMGWPMAANLVKKGGFAVTVHDLDGERASRFAREHGCAAASGLDGLAGCDTVVTMLPTGRDVRRVVTQEKGLAASLERGALVIDMSSSDPVGTRELGPVLAEHGIALMDAPVSGAVPRARAGTLAIMIGCEDRGLLERAKPILLAMGERLFEVGALGSGHAMKALNNLIAGAGFAVVCEAMLIGKRFGLDPTTMMDVLNASTGRNFATEVIMKEHVIGERFDSGFSVGLLAKDVKIAADLGRAVRLDAPLTRLVSERLVYARERLGADRDNSAAILAWNEDLPPDDPPER